MLPTVLCVDALKQPPDVEGLDIWGLGYTWHKLPPNPGIYCFYDGKTEEILYIGSASARGEVGWRRGLAGRMLGWRTGRRSASEKQLWEERRKRSVLVRCWVTQSAGDALKYEAEAIEKYKPPLNEKLVKPLQSILESGRRSRQRNSERPLEALPPETTIQRCSDCDTRKPLSDFYRSRSRRSGHASVCKKCIKIRDQRRHARRNQQGPRMQSRTHRATDIPRQQGQGGRLPGRQPVTDGHRPLRGAGARLGELKNDGVLAAGLSGGQHRHTQRVAGLTIGGAP